MGDRDQALSFVLSLGFSGVLLLLTPATAADTDAIWSLLQAGGQVVVMRHASTEPGIGDPRGYRLDDCATQRNLSAEGREEARRIGATFQSRGIPVGRVLSSRWCRCLETARLAFGRAEPWPPLDSIFDDRSREPEQTREVRALAGKPQGSVNLILVTHQVNIAALTGIWPRPGEMVVLTPEEGGTFRIAGRLRAPASHSN
jgi:phosphohistidine phosphatase SixA